MEAKGKRTSAGAKASKTPEEFRELEAHDFALFLVGRTVEVTDDVSQKETLRFKGVVRKAENSEKEVRRSISSLCPCWVAVPNRDQESRHKLYMC